MLPKWGTLLTYGSALVIRMFLLPSLGKIYPVVTRLILAFDWLVVISLVFLLAEDSSDNSSRLKKLNLVLSCLSKVCIFLLTSFWTGSRYEKAKAAATTFLFASGESTRSWSVFASSSCFAKVLIKSFAASSFLLVIAKASAAFLSWVFRVYRRLSKLRSDEPYVHMWLEVCDSAFFWLTKKLMMVSSPKKTLESTFSSTLKISDFSLGVDFFEI